MTWPKVTGLTKVRTETCESIVLFARPVMLNLLTPQITCRLDQALEPRTAPSHPLNTGTGSLGPVATQYALG